METRIRIRVTSDVVCLPELRSFIGKDVEIFIRECPHSITVKPFCFDAMKGGWPDEINDGFEEAVESWRGNDRASDIPD